MSLMNVFDVTKTGLVAQTSRLNLIAENIANADVESSTPEGAYRAQYPMFRAFFNEEQINAQGQGALRGAGRRHSCTESFVRPG